MLEFQTGIDRYRRLADFLRAGGHRISLESHDAPIGHQNPTRTYSSFRLLILREKVERWTASSHVECLRRQFSEVTAATMGITRRILHGLISAEM
jgi:hypothetical protein